MIHSHSISHGRFNDYGQHTWPFKFEDFVLSNYMYMYSKHNDPIITNRFHCKRNFALWKFRQSEFSPWRSFASANFQKTKFRFSGCEISPRWQRNFVWLNENTPALWRNFVAKFRRIFVRTKNEKHRISFAFLFCSLSIYSYQVGVAFWLLCSVYLIVAV